MPTFFVSSEVSLPVKPEFWRSNRGGRKDKLPPPADSYIITGAPCTPASRRRWIPAPASARTCFRGNDEGWASGGMTGRCPRRLSAYCLSAGRGRRAPGESTLTARTGFCYRNFCYRNLRSILLDRGAFPYGEAVLRLRFATLRTNGGQSFRVCHTRPGFAIPARNAEGPRAARQRRQRRGDAQCRNVMFSLWVAAPPACGRPSPPSGPERRWRC